MTDDAIVGSASPEGLDDDTKLTSVRSDAHTEKAVVVAQDLVAGYFPGVNILNGCSMYVEPGELVGIIGPNGAGKSTALKALFGLLDIRSGSVTLRGENITSAPAHKLVSMGMGFVPQTNNVFQALTIIENLEMGVYLRPNTFKERFEHVVGLFPRLYERRNQRAGALSGGERIEIRGFGSFSLHFRPPRMGRNPKTGDAVALPGKHVPHFKPGKELRERVNGSTTVSDDAR